MREGIRAEEVRRGLGRKRERIVKDWDWKRKVRKRILGREDWKMVGKESNRKGEEQKRRNRR